MQDLEDCKPVQVRALFIASRKMWQKWIEGIALICAGLTCTLDFTTPFALHMIQIRLLKSIARQYDGYHTA